MVVRDHRWVRIPSWRHFIRRAMQDGRFARYDLLPLLSTPRARDRMARFIARFRPKSTLSVEQDQATAWCNLLRLEGITQTLPPWPADWIAEIRQYFEQVTAHDPYRPHLGRFRFDGVPSDEINMGYFDPSQILAAPYVWRGIFNDPRVLAAAECYLGCKPILDNIGAWWSFGNRPAAKGTQRWHRDFDSIRGFKLFVYLSDVGPDQGPHVFLRRTHRDARLGTGIAQDEAVLYDIFGRSMEDVKIGPAGTWFLADTFGFHRGALPIHGNRLLLSAQYSINASPHMPRHQVWPPLPDGLDPHINQLFLNRTKG